MPDFTVKAHLNTSDEAQEFTIAAEDRSALDELLKSMWGDAAEIISISPGPKPSR